MKGVKYPIENSDVLADLLKGIDIKGLPAPEVVREVNYPVKSPAQLLHEIKEYLQMKGIS